MEALGREMIRHCGGLPLAILVLGGILVTKRSLPAWESVHNSIKTSLEADRGIGEDHEKEVLEILEWSYIHLPYQLKLCFVYLGQFPEDADIEAEKLYQMWMAEGFLLSKDRRDGETMLDVAESYLAKLAHKSMIGLEIEENESFIRKFSSCRLHDLMRDLSRRKAEEEDFFICHGLQLQQSAESSSRRDHCTRRVVIVDKLKFTVGSEAVASKSKCVVVDNKLSERLRSMILLDKDVHVDILMRFLRLNMSKFKLLRVLSLENLSNGSFEFQGASQLTNLRYLSFRESRLVKLPVIISKHLQTLDLRVFSYGTDLSSMNNMRHDLRCLRHLYLPDDTFSGKIWLVGANNLETIVNFDTTCCDTRDLSGISNLRQLIVRWISELEEMVKYLSSSSSSSLRYLTLCIHDVRDVISERGEGVLRQLFRSGSPSLHRLWLIGAGVLKLAVFNDDEDVNFLSSLTYLHIGEFKLEGDPMRVLEKIPNLRTLFIYNVFLEEKEMVCSATGNAFSQLKYLYLGKVKKWETWRVDEGAMPNLTSLYIENCPTLEKLPDGLRFLTSLEKIIITDMPEEFKNRLKEGGEDFYNIPPLAFAKFRE